MKKFTIKSKKKFKKNKILIINNLEIKYLKRNSDIAILAIPGISGLIPTLSMIKKSKKVLVANKESIICGWHLINRNSKKYKTKLIPVDSEHFSILKLLEHSKVSSIDKVYLIAFGGPFLGFKTNQLKKVSQEL